MHNSIKQRREKSVFSTAEGAARISHHPLLHGLTTWAEPESGILTKDCKFQSRRRGAEDKTASVCVHVCVFLKKVVRVFWGGRGASSSQSRMHRLLLLRCCCRSRELGVVLIKKKKKGIVNAKSCYNTDINMCRTAQLHTHTCTH